LRPVIGITGYCDPARWDIWDVPATLVPQVYVDAVVGGGGSAVVLPPGAAEPGILDRLDGLVFTAGPDLDPGLYGAAPHPETELRPGRDEPELALLRAARDADLPVLGVCRGMQLMAIAYGGTLHQHLPEALGHGRHCEAVGTLSYHRAHFEEGSRIAAILGDSTEVTSHHHQGVRDLGGLVRTGWADDGLPEAVEDPTRRFMVGVQWHPEFQHPALFAALVEAAAGETAGTALAGAHGRG
jgi:putative glutamine amidotransferase